MKDQVHCSHCSRGQYSVRKMVAMPSGNVICSTCICALKTQHISLSALADLRRSLKSDVLCLCCMRPQTDVPTWGSTTQAAADQPYVVCDSCRELLEDIVSTDSNSSPEESENLPYPTLHDPFLPSTCEAKPTFAEFVYAHLLKGLISSVCFDELMQSHLGSDYAVNTGIDYIKGRCWFQSPQRVIQTSAFILGSYNNKDEDFLWTIDNTDISDQISDEIFDPTYQVAEFAVQHGYSEWFSYEDNPTTRLLPIRGDYVAALACVLTGAPSYVEMRSSESLSVYALLGPLGNEVVKPPHPGHPNCAFWIPIYQLALMQKHNKWPALDLRQLLQHFADHSGLSLQKNALRMILSDAFGSRIEITFTKGGRGIASWKEELQHVGQYGSAVALDLLGCSYD